MPLTNAEKQSAHRKRQAARMDARTEALQEIQRRLGADNSEWAGGIRKVITDALV